MTTGNKSNDRATFIRFRLAWLFGAGMLMLYVATRSHWSSPEGLPQIAKISGWEWRDELFGPVTFLITYPFRWLPATWVPLSLSFFSACCAALTLVLLFRSVTLLPHSSTHSERMRSMHSYGFLTIPTRWVPPVLAVLACGLQITFWENSTTTTSETFDLLLFACLIWCFLEFRVRHNDTWLYCLGLVYGLAVANNWAMAAFFPGFLVAVAWVKGFNIFSVDFLSRIAKEGLKALQPRFVARLVGCFLAGFSLFLLLPLMASLTSTANLEFWPTLKYTALTYKAMMRSLPRYVVLLSCVPPGLCILLMGIRWSQNSSAPNTTVLLLIDTIFNLAYGALLLVCLGTVLDLPLSPRILNKGALPCLPLYYLGSLGIGFLAGYFLLIVTPEPVKSWPRPHPLTHRVNLLFAAVVWISLVVTPVLLVYRNLPYILQKKNGPLTSYAARLEKNTPPAGAVIFSEDSTRLQCLQTALTRSGRASDYAFVNASAFAGDPSYIQFLDKRSPGLNLANLVTNQFSQITNQPVLLGVVKKLAENRDLYFLHPSYNIYCEVFSLEPHGFFYKMSERKGRFDRLSSEVIDENQIFWDALAKQEFPDIIQKIPVPPKVAVKQKASKRIINELSRQPDKDRSARDAGRYYSGGLNDWGVTLQKNGNLVEAGKCFELASQLNPKPGNDATGVRGNLAAEINRNYNKDLRENKAVVPVSLQEMTEKFGSLRNLNKIVTDGPIDEPSFCHLMGKILSNAKFFTQSIQQLERAKVLAPDDLQASGSLGRVFLSCADNVGALAEANQILRSQPKNSDGLFVKGTALVRLKLYEQAIAPLSALIEIETNNISALINRSCAYIESGKLDLARNEYEHLTKTAPEMNIGFYGLAEVAYRSKDTLGAITNYSLFLQKAGTNSSLETRVAQERLSELKKVQQQ